MTNLPKGFSSKYADTGEVRLHVVHNVVEDEERPAVLFLHGFPEYWAAWRPVAERLGNSCACILPDQRGYNLSDAPQDVEDYRAGKIVADALAVADNMLGNRKFFLAGHDWGGSIAYAVAIRHGERLDGLIIANGVHPVLFQHALVNDPEQQAASQYFHILRAPDAAERMAEDGYRRTFSMFEKFSASPWLTEETRREYLEAWSRPGRMEAMLNWYRATSTVVPRPGEPAPEAPLAEGSPDRFGVHVPHLLIWGEQDQALRPSATEGIEKFVPAVRTVRLANSGHWLVHEEPERIADEIADFVEANRPSD